MGLFDKILDKLGIEKGAASGSPTGYAAPSEKGAAPAKSGAKSAATSKPAGKSYPGEKPGAKTPLAGRGVKTEKPGDAARAAAVAGHASAKKEMPMVDVVAKLDALAKVSPEKLDWKVSVVDLLKLLELDSSFKAREELAKELGCPPEFMGGDYSKMNIWTHKTVLQKIAENGGNIPASMLK